MTLRSIHRRIRWIIISLGMASVCLVCYYVVFLSPTIESPRTVGLNLTSNENVDCIRDFQVIEKDLAFAYSAYIDDRPTRDTAPTDLPVVRIMIYFDRKIKAQENWHCRFWYKDAKNPFVKPITRITDMDTFAPHRRLMPAMVLCSLPTYVNIKPDNVSLVPITAQIPSNYICIEDLISRKNRFLNQTTQTSFPEFTICTKPIHDGYYKIQDIVNFIEVNRILGVDMFIFYIDAKTSNLSIISCLESYTKLGIAEVYLFSPPVFDDSLIYHGQIVTLTECLYRVMYRTKFVINVDLDEFVVPTTGSNLSQMVNIINEKTSKSNNIAAFNFKNQFFPLQTFDDPEFENNSIAKEHQILALLQTMKQDYTFPHNDRAKVMAYPERILVWHTHLILSENVVNSGGFVCYVDKNDALIYHYRKWTDATKLIRERRMHEYASQLLKTIPSAMNRCLSSS